MIHRKGIDARGLAVLLDRNERETDVFSIIRQIDKLDGVVVNCRGEGLLDIVLAKHCGCCLWRKVAADRYRLTVRSQYGEAIEPTHEFGAGLVFAEKPTMGQPIETVDQAETVGGEICTRGQTRSIGSA